MSENLFQSLWHVARLRERFKRSSHSPAKRIIM